MYSIGPVRDWILKESNTLQECFLINKHCRCFKFPYNLQCNPCLSVIHLSLNIMETTASFNVLCFLFDVSTSYVCKWIEFRDGKSSKVYKIIHDLSEYTTYDTYPGTRCDCAKGSSFFYSCHTKFCLCQRGVLRYVVPRRALCFVSAWRGPSLGSYQNFTKWNDSTAVCAQERGLYWWLLSYQ